eukprot:TRINITY_DN48125_c0_g1_i1.p1 TRINITY_DN48125_c0_g1~~TRINITY_DN48125_c0_g1_i1.p1  ORF type:complete len:320 (-),score=17.82 TRINITY_DN48125_c0_g1_i1:201-1118(-)
MLALLFLTYQLLMCAFTLRFSCGERIPEGDKKEQGAAVQHLNQSDGVGEDSNSEKPKTPSIKENVQSTGIAARLQNGAGSVMRHGGELISTATQHVQKHVVKGRTIAASFTPKDQEGFVQMFAQGKQSEVKIAIRKAAWFMVTTVQPRMQEHLAQALFEDLKNKSTKETIKARFSESCTIVSYYQGKLVTPAMFRKSFNNDNMSLDQFVDRYHDECTTLEGDRATFYNNKFRFCLRCKDWLSHGFEYWRPWKDISLRWTLTGTIECDDKVYRCSITHVNYTNNHHTARHACKTVSEFEAISASKT